MCIDDFSVNANVLTINNEFNLQYVYTIYTLEYFSLFTLIRSVGLFIFQNFVYTREFSCTPFRRARLRKYVRTRFGLPFSSSLLQCFPKKITCKNIDSTPCIVCVYESDETIWNVIK